MNNDYKRLWDILHEELQRMQKCSKEVAITTFESDNRSNTEAPIESRNFLCEMESMRASQEVINLMQDIEIRELLFFKHEEKCKKHNEQKHYEQNAKQI